MTAVSEQTRPPPWGRRSHADRLQRTLGLASALTWARALCGPGCSPIVTPYQIRVDGDRTDRRPAGTFTHPYRGYHGADDTAAQDEATLLDWLWNGDVHQWAIAPGRLGLVVVDVDDPALLPEVLALYGETEVFVTTPRGGMHLYYRAMPGTVVASVTGVRGPGSYDLKARGSTVHAPGSPHHVLRDKTYLAFAPGLGDNGAVVGQGFGELLAPRSLWPRLPVFPAEAAAADWARHNPTPEVPDRLEERVLEGTPAERDALARYMAAAGPAVSGQGGHRHTFSLLRKVGDLGAPEWLALELALEWDRTCEPPWGEDAIRAKVADAYRTRDLPVGWRAAEVVADPADADDVSDAELAEMLARSNQQAAR